MNWYDKRAVVVKTENSGHRLLQTAMRHYECLEQSVMIVVQEVFALLRALNLVGGGGYFCCLTICVYVVITMSF